MAARGLRVLGVARGHDDGARLPDDHAATSLRAGSGLVGLADPIRADGAGRHRRVPRAPASAW